MTEPTTEAGRRLVEDSSVLLMMDSSGDIIGLNEGELELQVIAIEAEARAGALDVDVLERIRRETRDAVIEGDASDCSSPDCISDAVYEIVRAILAETDR